MELSKYYHDIIRYFFHHQASEEIIDRVQKRILHSQDDADDVMREIWERLDDELLDDADVENAYERTADTVFGRESHTRSLSWMRIAAIWAVPFLFLCGSMFFYINARQNSDAYDDIAFIHKFTANGERCLITLPDSSKVWLNGGSTLIYPSRFVSAERNVCLSGEAFFDVVKDSRPFIVDVNQIKLKVLGTTFNVFSYPDNSHVVATLETGKIQVSIENNKQAYFLRPNDQMVFNSKTGEVNVRKVTATNSSAWRTGTLYFEDTRFCQAIQQLEHVYNVKIHVLNNQYNKQTIRAHFNSNETMEEIMEVFKMLIPSLNYEISGRDIFIK